MRQRRIDLHQEVRRRDKRSRTQKNTMIYVVSSLSPWLLRTLQSLPRTVEMEGDEGDEGDEGGHYGKDRPEG